MVPLRRVKERDSRERGVRYTGLLRLSGELRLGSRSSQVMMEKQAILTTKSFLFM